MIVIETLNLNKEILSALNSEGYVKPTAIQEQAIPVLLEGHDLLGTAQTGTGKTAAFALPILQMLSEAEPKPNKEKKIKALVIAPTRELANQIGDSFKVYGKNLKLKTLVIYGGVSQFPQTKRLKRGVDILVATPGRLLDLINQKHVNISEVEHFVLDEADLMLDMGMLQEVEKIVKFLPQERQTMFFSATMPKAIEKLTRTLLKNPINVEVTPVSSTVDTIKQEVFFVDRSNKMNLLFHILKDERIETALIFSRTKHGANKMVNALNANGFKSEAIHGNKTQRAREIALKKFKNREVNILVATDIAARGIDINELSHVINYNLPEVPETYVHRIGRTGRSGHEGVALSFCDNSEKGMLIGIQKLTGKNIPEHEDYPFRLNIVLDKPRRKRKSPYSNENNSQRNNGGRSGNRNGNKNNRNNKNKNRRNRKSNQSNASTSHSRKNNRGRKSNNRNRNSNVR